MKWGQDQEQEMGVPEWKGSLYLSFRLNKKQKTKNKKQKTKKQKNKKTKKQKNKKQKNKKTKNKKQKTNLKFFRHQKALKQVDTHQ